MQRRTPRPEPLRWLAAQRGIDLAPFTGTDTKAAVAIAHCWDLFAYTRSPGVLHAIQNLLREMQPSTAPLTKLLIARSMDWSDCDRYWPLVWGQQDLQPRRRGTTLDERGVRRDPIEEDERRATGPVDKQ